MRKVKNIPDNYIKRVQVRSVREVVASVSTSPIKRSIEDFRNARIDDNFYVTFSPRIGTDKRNNE